MLTNVRNMLTSLDRENDSVHAFSCIWTTNGWRVFLKDTTHSGALQRCINIMLTLPHDKHHRTALLACCLDTNATSYDFTVDNHVNIHKVTSPPKICLYGTSMVGRLHLNYNLGAYGWNGFPLSPFFFIFLTYPCSNTKY